MPGHTLGNLVFAVVSPVTLWTVETWTFWVGFKKRIDCFWHGLCYWLWVFGDYSTLFHDLTVLWKVNSLVIVTSLLLQDLYC